MVKDPGARCAERASTAARGEAVSTTGSGRGPLGLRYKVRVRVGLCRPAGLRNLQCSDWKQVMVNEPGALRAARASYMVGGVEVALQQQRAARGAAHESKVQRSRAWQSLLARGFARSPGSVVDAGNGQRTRRAVCGAREHCGPRRGGSVRAQHPTRSPGHKARVRVGLCEPTVLSGPHGPGRTRVMVKQPGAPRAARASSAACGKAADTTVSVARRVRGTNFTHVSASAVPRFCAEPRALCARG